VAFPPIIRKLAPYESYEKQGTAHDPHAVGHELQGRAARPGVEKMAEKIVKVQRALYPKTAPWLVYAEDRRETFIEASKIPDHVKKALGDNVKGYFLASWDGGRWNFGAKVSDPGW
jgi:hypothetical protein